MRKNFSSDHDDDDDEIDIDAVHPADDVWTPDLVGKVLVAAIRAAGAMSRAVGPKGYGSTMPAIFREAEDFEGWIAADIKRAPRRMTSATVSRIEDALHWQSRYLQAESGQTTVLKVWIKTKLSRRPFGAECKRRGWSRATAYRTRDRALSTIAQGLMRDGADVWRS